MEMIIIHFELHTRDVDVAGTFGDVEWIDHTCGQIVTDAAAVEALIERLEDDDNVLYFEECTIKEADAQPLGYMQNRGASY